MWKLECKRTPRPYRYLPLKGCVGHNGFGLGTFVSGLQTVAEGSQSTVRFLYEAVCVMVIGGDKVPFDVVSVTKFIEAPTVVFTVALKGFPVPIPQRLHSEKHLDLDLYALLASVACFQP